MEWHDLSEEGLLLSDDPEDAEIIEKDLDVEEVTLPKGAEFDVKSNVLGKEKTPLANFESLDFVEGDLNLMTVGRVGSRIG